MLLGWRSKAIDNGEELTAGLVNMSVDLKFFPHAPVQKSLVNRVSYVFLYFVMITLLLVKLISRRWESLKVSHTSCNSTLYLCSFTSYKHIQQLVFMWLLPQNGLFWQFYAFLLIILGIAETVSFSLVLLWQITKTSTIWQVWSRLFSVFLSSYRLQCT